MLGWIPLAADAAAFEPGAEDVVEVAFYEGGLAWPRPVDSLPGFYGGEGDLVRRDAEYIAYVV